MFTPKISTPPQLSIPQVIIYDRSLISADHQINISLYLFPLPEGMQYEFLMVEIEGVSDALIWFVWYRAESLLL